MQFGVTPVNSDGPHTTCVLSTSTPSNCTTHSSGIIKDLQAQSPLLILQKAMI
jgi:hypothetical protein